MRSPWTVRLCFRSILENELIIEAYTWYGLSILETKFCCSFCSEEPSALAKTFYHVVGRPLGLSSIKAGLLYIMSLLLLELSMKGDVRNQIEEIYILYILKSL